MFRPVVLIFIIFNMQFSLRVILSRVQCWSCGTYIIISLHFVFTNIVYMYYLCKPAKSGSILNNCFSTENQRNILFYLFITNRVNYCMYIWLNLSRNVGI